MRGPKWHSDHMKMALSHREPRKDPVLVFGMTATTRHHRSEGQYCLWQIPSSSCAISSQAWKIGHGHCTLTMLVIRLIHQAWLDLLYIVCSTVSPLMSQVHLRTEADFFPLQTGSSLEPDLLKSTAVFLNGTQGKGGSGAQHCCYLLWLEGFGGGCCSVAVQRP